MTLSEQIYAQALVLTQDAQDEDLPLLDSLALLVLEGAATYLAHSLTIVSILSKGAISVVITAL